MGGGCCIGDCCIMDNFIGNFFRDIFGGSGGGGGGCGYHPGPSETESHAKKISDELAEMKANIRKSSEKIERDIIESINTSMTELIRILEGMNRESYGGKSLNINISGIKQKNEELKKQVIGHIGNVMDERLVQTDRELSVILEERDDDKRGKNFDRFCKKVQKQSLMSLKTQIISTVKQQEEMIRGEIQTRLDEVDRSMKEAMKSYSELVDAKEKDDEALKIKQVEYMYKRELFHILIGELNDGGDTDVSF